MTLTSEKTGRCMCGAVTFTAKNVPDTYGVCHCEMCRRWLGGPFLGVSVPTEGITWSNEAQIKALQSSDWAERAWCQRCGSALYYRVTEEGDWSGATEIPIGIFDAPDGFTMTSEIYIDHKPDSYAFTDSDRKVLTRQQCVEKFARLDED